MLLLLLINCFHLFVDYIHNVSLQEEVVDMWTSKNQRQMLTSNDLQGMQFKTIGMNFSIFLYHAQTYYICCTMCC